MPREIDRDAHSMIIGAMKCGTSSLYSYLHGQPEICPCISKEPEFFSENQGHGVDVENYSDLFSFDRSKHKYTLEASTGYTKYPSESNVPKNIHGYGIYPKFIYIIRNPFDRIQSHFNFMQKDASWSLHIGDTHLVNTSNYFLQLEQYRQYFPLERFLVLDFDDLKSNPSSVLKDIYEFLDLSKSYFPESYEVKNRTPAISKFERIMRKSRFTAFLHYLPRPLKQIAKVTMQKTCSPDKRKLSDSERELIYNELNASMSNLYNIYGFDARKWGFNF